jgi:hypothetical protein
MPLPTELPTELPRLCTLSALLVLAGCTALNPPPAPAPPPPPPPMVAPARPLPPDPERLAATAAQRLIAFQERLRDLGPMETAREQLRLGDAADDPGATLELALLLAQGRGNTDVARALTLVEPLARPDARAPWQALARLLQARLQEQKRLEEQIERQGQQLRDQQRRIDQLGSQLEALKAIERSLAARPAVPPSAASAASAVRTP